jgi:hypothetical protein
MAGAGGMTGAGGMANTSGVGGTGAAAGAGGMGGTNDAGIATGSLVVGVIQASNVGVSKLQVVMRVNGVVVQDQTYIPPLTFPMEFSFNDLPDGDVVEIELNAYASLTPNTRTATSTIVAGKTLLLRIALSKQCLFGYEDEDIIPPDCVAPQTCNMGHCQNSDISPRPARRILPFLGLLQLL